MRYFIFYLFVIVYLGEVEITQTISDEDFCHPHCLVTCLPSCACCNHKDDASKSLETNRRLQSKLERLEQILKDKDLEVGFVCHDSCKHRCLPSCKFECCRARKTKRNKLKPKSNALNLPENFDLKKLLKSMETTQREYKKLEKYIEKVNTRPSEKKHAVEGFQFVDDKPNNVQPKKNQKKEKTRIKKEKSDDRLQNIQILEKLVKLQDEIPNKGKNTQKDKSLKFQKDSSFSLSTASSSKAFEKSQNDSDETEKIVKFKSKAELQREADSPYQKLLSSKPKLKVEIEDDTHVKDSLLKKERKLTKSHKSTTLSADKMELSENLDALNQKIEEKVEASDSSNHNLQKHHSKHHGKGYCATSCKQFCYPSCNFECCTRTFGTSQNSAIKDSPWTAPLTSVSDSYKNITNGPNLTHSGPKLDKLAKLLNMPDTESLLHTKNQLDNLIGLLRTKSNVLKGSTPNSTTTTCSEGCKRECLPSCPFNCC